MAPLLAYDCDMISSLPLGPAPSVPACAHLRFQPVRASGVTKRLAKAETSVLTSPGVRVSGLARRQLLDASSGAFPSAGS